MIASGSVGAASAEQSKRMLQRCWGWDYKSPCIYQITIALADRRSMALGRLVIDDDGGPADAPDEADGEPDRGGAAT